MLASTLKTTLFTVRGRESHDVWNVPRQYVQRQRGSTRTQEIMREDCSLVLGFEIGSELMIVSIGLLQLKEVAVDLGSSWVTKLKLRT